MKYYVKEKGMDKIKLDAKELIIKRIAPETPKNDGKQTPMRQVHPVRHLPPPRRRGGCRVQDS